MCFFEVVGAREVVREWLWEWSGSVCVTVFVSASAGSMQITLQEQCAWVCVCCVPEQPL